MGQASKSEMIIGEIEAYVLDHLKELVTITYQEGDSYRCCYDTNDWDDNEEDLDSPNYEEWYTLIFEVKEILVSGPNKDPRYDYIEISEKVMPYKVQCGDTVLYEDGRLLI